MEIHVLDGFDPTHGRNALRQAACALSIVFLFRLSRSLLIRLTGQEFSLLFKRAKYV